MRQAAGVNAPPRVTLDATLEFLQVLWALDHGLQTVSKRMRVGIGLTGLQRLVLRIVARNPGIAAGTLADTLHLHPSTLTGVLDRLARSRLLLRSADPADGRRALFAATAAGEALLSRRAGTVEHAVGQLLAQEPAGRIAAVRVVLEELTAILGRTNPMVATASGEARPRATTRLRRRRRLQGDGPLRLGRV